jgi:exopolysaccharide biosynthesis protein
MLDVNLCKRLCTGIVLCLVVVAAAPGDDPFPLHLVPMQSSSDSINFTKWTPKNWTQAFSAVMISNNLYLLQIQNGNSFRVVVPETDSNRIRMGTTPWSTARMRHSVVSSSKSAASQVRSSRMTGRSLQCTSEQSRHHNCTYAMNGGPFQRDGSLCGVVVVEDGTMVASDFGSTVGFGIAKPSPAKIGSISNASVWIMGRLQYAEVAKELNVRQFVSGFDWLVYNGRNIAAYGNNTTGADRAARSALGVTKDGTLLLVVSDGCEHW